MRLSGDLVVERSGGRVRRGGDPAHDGAALGGGQVRHATDECAGDALAAQIIARVQVVEPDAGRTRRFAVSDLARSAADAHGRAKRR